MSVFRDDWDRKAHDIICIVKYGNPGGSVATKEMHRVSDILRGESFKPPIVMPPLPVAAVPMPAPFIVPMPTKVI